ncbi:TetR/AcrR family transcriptional regulator C-terminal domain-containing protein [Streptomyces sp. NPDC002540]
MPIPEGEDWKAMLRNYAHTSRALLARHNDLAQLTFAHIPNTLRIFDAAGALLKSVIESGVPPRAAAWALDNLSVHVASPSSSPGSARPSPPHRPHASPT